MDASAIVFPGAYIGPNVTIGADCVIGPGASIGAPGFGYVRQEDGSQLYRSHTAGVVIERDVHIGANACVDQGRHRATVIGEGSRVDNGCHIAHNVLIGRRCMVVALAELSGSVVVGDDAWIGPSACVRQWLTIGAGSTVGMGAVVVKNVPPGETWAGNPARKFEKRP